MAAIKVSALNIYPVKSCAGISLQSGKLTKTGLEFDRRWMVVHENGMFITQREIPKMALVKTALIEDHGETVLQLSAPDLEPMPLQTRANASGNRLRVQVWNDVCDAIDLGDVVANWLTDALGTRCRLVEMAADFARPVDPDYAITSTNQVSFADGFPMLLVSQESLDDLNSKLETSLPMNRFRPNIVVTGCDAFAEDKWFEIKIGNVQMHVVKPCDRCTITTIDQTTVKRGVEPLKTLATYRARENKVMFAQNVIHSSEGVVNVNDEVTVLSMREPAVVK